MNKYIISGAITALLFASTIGLAKTAGWGSTPVEEAGSSWKHASNIEETDFPALVGPDAYPQSRLSEVNSNEAPPESTATSVNTAGQKQSTAEQHSDRDHDQEQIPVKPESVAETSRQEAELDSNQSKATVDDTVDDAAIDYEETENAAEDRESDTNEKDKDGVAAEELNSEKASTEDQEEAEHEDVEEKDEKDLPQEVEESELPSTKGWLTIIQQDVALQQSVNEILEIWGHNYAEFHNAINEADVWQYSLGAVPGSPVHDNAAEVNIAGLLAGHLEAQLFISWNASQEVSSYALYYVDEGQVFEYRAFEDGKIRHTAITT